MSRQGQSGNPFNEHDDNPFNSDKNEFGTQYSSNPNTATQLFKDGGFFSDTRRKILATFVILAAAAFGAFYYFTSTEHVEETLEIPKTTENEKPPAVDEKKEDSHKTVEKDKKNVPPEATKDHEADKTTPSTTDLDDELAEEAMKIELNSTENPVLQSPENGVTRFYDQSAQTSQFKFSGAPATILFSNNQNMHPVIWKITTKTGEYSYKRFLPGTWYWQVINGKGKTEVRSFTIKPAEPRSISIKTPQAGGEITGTGGLVSWKGDQRISYYRIEISDAGFTAPKYRFATSGTELALKGVTPGNYQLRVGAFSEVSGKWEYTEPQNIVIK